MSFPKTAVLTLLIGPSGAGKSTWAYGGKTEYELSAADLSILPTHVLSTDQFRWDMTGARRNTKGWNAKDDFVYQAVIEIAQIRLKYGIPTVIDATHLDREVRIRSALIADPSIRVRYVVLDRPTEEKREHAGWRAKSSYDIIGTHEAKFDTQLENILKGDGLPNVVVFDMRRRL